MTYCNHCNQEMDSRECKLDRIEIEGEIRPRVPYRQPFFDERYALCHDCGVIDGKFHHPGCDMETCINCGGQLISCPCHIGLEDVKIPLETLNQLLHRESLE